MTTTTIDAKQRYVAGYKLLQAEWKKKDKELLLVGRLAYWTYWISKFAENSTNNQEKSALFQLKANALALLIKSKYVQIRKYVPEHHKRICYNHYEKMKKSGTNPHVYLRKNLDSIQECKKCKKSGVRHFFSLYSIAVLNEKENREGRKPYFVFYAPYLKLQKTLPDLDSLESVKFYSGSEMVTIDKDERVREVDLNALKLEMIVQYYTKNYNALSELLN